MGVGRLRQDRRPAAGRRPRRPTRRPPRCAGAPGPSSTPCGPRWPRSPTSALEAPSDDRHRRGRGRRPRLVRVAGRCSAAGRGHPRPRAGLGARRAALRRARRRGGRGAGDRRSPIRPTAAPRWPTAVGRAGAPTTGSCSPRPTAPRRLLAALHDARDLGGVQVAAIGPGTADALRRRQHRGRPRARAVRGRGAARGVPGAAGRRRPGAAGPGRGGPRRAARRPAGRGVGRSTWSTPTAPSAAADRRRPARPRSPAADVDHLHVVVDRRPASSTPFGADARARRSWPASVRSPSATARDARPRRSTSRPTEHTIDGLVDALVTSMGRGRHRVVASTDGARRASSSTSTA